MLEAAIIGRCRSTPGLFSMRRRMRRLRRFNWRWTLAFTRKPPGGRTVEGVKYLDCSPKPGGFRASRFRSASDYTWLRTRVVGKDVPLRDGRTGPPSSSDAPEGFASDVISILGCNDPR